MVVSAPALRDSIRAEQTMHMPATRQRWTAEEVRALQDESRAWPRYELIDGELLVTNAPRAQHQRAVAALFLRLSEYLAREPIGEVLFSPADIELEPETIVQPDIFVLPLVGGRRSPEWKDVKSLLLACEVLSPNTARDDRVTKRRFFSRVGVGEYWVVDLDAEIVERSGPSDDRVELITDTVIWKPDVAAMPFSLDLAVFFSALREDA